jgi:hypothetical protein
MSDCEAEGGEAAAGILMVVSVGAGDVGPAADFQDADGEVTEGGHDGGAGADAELGGVLAVGDVAYVVEGFDDDGAGTVFSCDQKAWTPS